MINDTQFVSPLRQHMIDDMTMRKLSPKTQTAYIRAVTKLASYLSIALFNDYGATSAGRRRYDV